MMIVTEAVSCLLAEHKTIKNTGENNFKDFGLWYIGAKLKESNNLRSGICEYWTVLDEQLFFLAVIKFGIVYKVLKSSHVYPTI